MLAHGIARGAGIGKPRRNNAPYPSSERCNTSSGPCCKSCGPFSDATRPRAFHGASFALGLGPLDHVDMSAVDALKQQNRGESVVEPGHLPGELHARRATTTGQPRLAGHPCLDHWRSRRNREYRTPRVGRSHFGGGGSGSRSAVPTYPQPPHKWTTSPDSGRTGGSLRASRIASPHWGHRGAVSGSFRTSMLGNQCGEHFRPRRSTGQYCSLTCRKASARFRTVSVPQLRNGASTTSPIIDSHSR